MSEVKAQLRYLRIAPKKVRRIAFLLKGMGYADALAQLKYLPQRSARPLYKLIFSAGANAKHNLRLDPLTLSITRILVDPGPAYKRMRPRAHGAGFPIAKKMSHITVFLGVRKGKLLTQSARAAITEAFNNDADEGEKKVRKTSFPKTRSTSKEKTVAPARRQRVFSRKAI